MTTQSHPAIRVSWPHVVLSLIGAGISMYAIHVHNLVMQGKETGCGITETITCDKVLASTYGEIFGIPLGMFGLLFFVIVLLSAITTNPATTLRQMVLQRLLVCGVGFAVSVALTYISLAVIGAACPICLATHATTFVLFVVSLWQFWKMRRAPDVSESKAAIE